MMHERRKADLCNYTIFEINQFIKDLESSQKDTRQTIYNKIQNYVYPQFGLNPFYGKNIKNLSILNF